MDRTLLQRVGDGDSEAMRSCLDEYGGLVWTLARRFLSSRQDAEDAVQDAFVSIWQSAGRYDPSMGSEATFVAMIARRRLIDRIRKKALPEVGLTPGVGEPSTDKTSAGPEFGEDVAKAEEALREFSGDQQNVLRLALVHGVTHEKIATATGIPLGTVKTHVRRGLAKLRDKIRTSEVVT